MDQQLKERLVGIIVLVLFAVIFIPMFFSEPIDLVSKEKTNLSNSKESEFVSKADGWTVTTRDGKLSAHFEHTIAVGEKTAEILTTYKYIEKDLKS